MPTVSEESSPPRGLTPRGDYCEPLRNGVQRGSKLAQFMHKELFCGEMLARQFHQVAVVCEEDNLGFIEEIECQLSPPRDDGFRERFALDVNARLSRR